MEGILMKRIALVALSPVFLLAGGCGAESQPALTQSPQELQALAQQEDAAVHDLESKRTEQ